MGVMGAVIGGGLLGLGAAALGKKKQSAAIPMGTESAARPEVPDIPVPAEPEAGAGSAAGTTRNAGMEAEREREYQAAQLRRLQAPELFTSGLGATGQAATAKKSLLGG